MGFAMVVGGGTNLLHCKNWQLPDEEKVVLVGHSYGGLCISLAMQSFPQKISVAVFVSAYLPHFKEPPVVFIQEVVNENYFKRIPMEAVMDGKFTFDQGDGNLPNSVVLGSNYNAKMYRHCALEDIELAKMLVRPHPFFIEDMAKESLPTEEKYGSIKRDFVLCEDDQVVGGRISEVYDRT
ncbi:methylesterase 10-like [Coffea eugenioides]|uniref:methylesterase 10-like n=1 Tax=Coffea eugenioides TaxID=49369 RepID=UPI000F60E96D|nr:methylesterase 10-like [Coffea eugenioides]